MLFTKKRSDGTYIRKVHIFTQLLPYLMPKRADATIFFETEIDLTYTLKYIRRRKKEPQQPKISVFLLILYASLRSMSLRPKMNRFVSGGRYYQRNRISFNFVAKRDLSDEGEEVNVTMSFSPFISLEKFCNKIYDHVLSIKEGSGTDSEKINSSVTSLPGFIIRFLVWGLKFLDRYNALPKSVINSLPFFSSIFFTHVGSVGIDAPLHHLFELGNNSIFCAVGKIRKVNVINKDGTVEKRDKIKITYTYDERIADGIYCGRAIDMVRDLVEEPEKLEVPFELTEEQLKNLGLKDSELNNK